MKIAVIYVSKTGSTQLCAEYITSRLKDCSSFNLEKENPNLLDYDVILIGSGIRMGKLYKPIVQILKNNVSLLLEKKIGLFICNFYPETFEKSITKNIPKELLDNIEIVACGGVPPFNKPVNTDWLKYDIVESFLKRMFLI